MSVFNAGIYTRLTTELFGFGVTLNPDGSVLSVTGPTTEYVTVAPTAVRNGGSLAQRSNGDLYGTAGGGTWYRIGGSSGAGAFALPDDVSGTWGTTSPLQVASTYVSASNRWDLQGGNTTNAQASVSYRFRTGTVANSVAAGGGASGSQAFTTGDTSNSNAGGTGGDTGTLAFTTGSATNAAGTSGASGPITFTTGTSATGNSGSIVFTIGTAGGTQGTIQAVGRLTTTDGVTGGTVRTVGGLAFATTADSGVITGNGAAQTFNQSYSIPGSTLKAGSTGRVIGCVRRTGLNAADVATVAVRLGGTVYLTSVAVAAAVNDRCYFEFRFTSRGAPGGAVTVVGVGATGWSTNLPVVNVPVLSPGGATANLNTVGALTVDVQITMPNNIGNTAVLEQFNVDIF
jgi:hypothetical protein